MIPKHSACLTSADYVPYLSSLLSRKSSRNLEVQDVWAQLIPSRHIYPTPTGRHALWYFLDHAGFKPGDEVLIAAYNYYVVVRLVIQKGLKPVFVDIDPDTLCMDAADLESKISARGRLVIVTHMFGNPADMEAISALCRKHGLMLFEDCAHAVGSSYAGRQVGQEGDAALFSFEITKLVSSFGGGILVLSNTLAKTYSQCPHCVSRLHSASDTFFRCMVSLLSTPGLYGWTLHPLIRFALKQAERGRPALRNVIEPSKNDATYQFKPDTRAPFKPFQSRMHRLQLRRLQTNVRRRREIVQRVKNRLQRVPAVRLLTEDRHGQANGSYFGILVPDPAALARYLERNGVVSNPQEYFDCSRLKQFAEYRSDCPNSALASDHILRLPSYPGLEDQEVDHIATCIEAYFTHCRSGSCPKAAL
jgi:dTDP-4-amino-4,6-dideoxygalactose transaminase